MSGRYTFREWWGSFFSDLWRNLGRGWPVLVLFVIWMLVASLILFHTEEISNYGNAVFYTWEAVFGEDISPQSPAGKILYLADAISGYVLLGFVLWFILESA